MVHSMIRRVIPALSSFVFILYCGDRDALVGVFSLFVVRGRLLLGRFESSAYDLKAQHALLRGAPRAALPSLHLLTYLHDLPQIALAPPICLTLQAYPPPRQPIHSSGIGVTLQATSDAPPLHALHRMWNYRRARSNSKILCHSRRRCRVDGTLFVVAT